MREALPRMRPDVALFLVGINDLAYSIQRYTRSGGVTYEWTTNLSRNWRYRIHRNSRLIQMLYVWKTVLIDRAVVVKRTGPPRFEPKPLQGEVLVFPQDLLGFLPKLAEYARSLRRLIKLGCSMGVRTVFLTQPMLYADTDRWRKMEGVLYWVRETRGRISAADYWRVMDAHNQELIRVCRAENVPCFDLASAVPHGDEYFHDGVHFSEAGAALVAKRVAEYLTPRVAASAP